MSEPVKKVANALLEAAGNSVGFNAGGMFDAVMGEPKRWAPVVPDDLYADPLPQVAADGTAVCWQCTARLPFAQLNISGSNYVCGPCALRTAQANAAAAPVDTDVKIGRGRWWLWPLISVAFLGLLVWFFFFTKQHSL